MTIQISRAFDPSKGLQSIENLSGYTFSAESYAHEFIVSTPEGFDGAVSARFLRADNITVFVSGSISGIDGSAIIDLPPECYAVPGRFFMAIYVTAAAVKTCIYAGIGTVYRSESDTVIAGDGTLETIEDVIHEATENAVISAEEAANMMAIYARNVSTVEGVLDGYVDSLAQFMTAISAYGIEVANTPNLLDPNGFYYTGTVDGTEGTYVYGQTNKCYAYGKAYVKNAFNTSADTAGSDPDEISETVTTLSSTITDTDGTVYNKGLAFTVSTAADSGYNNADELIFMRGNHGAGTLPVSENANHDLELTVGHRYTMTCWARVTSGSDMRLVFSYSPEQAGTNGEREFFDISGSAWRQLTWHFTFNPSGNQYYYYTVYTDGNGNYSSTQDETYTTKVSRRQALWTKTVGFGVCRKYAGTVELCGFRLVEGDNYAANRFDAIEDDVDSLATDVSNVLSSIAPVETGSTATANYAAGELLVWKNQLCKASTAITSGATLAVGTNLTATTLAAELAALNA